MVLIAVGLFWLLRLRKSAHHELASLAKKRQQREQLLSEDRLPTPENTDYATAKPTVAVTAPATNEDFPRRPLDAFIAIAGAKEQMRRLAAGNGVGLVPDESFGFATYAHEGPREKELDAVHEQIGLTRLLVEKLFAARPGRLLAIHREQPNSGKGDGGRPGAEDFFALDARLDLRAAGLMDGRAIQLEFTGQTPVLRTFLNSLGVAPEPLVVRSVEVEPIQNDSKLSGHFSKFSVVVQLVKPAGQTGKEEFFPVQSRGTPVSWAPPAVDGNRGGDLFDPVGELLAKSGNRQLREAAKATAPNGFELLEIKREPYRLQLAGYYGAPGGYTAAFVSPGSPDTWLAREGHRFEALGLILKEFALKKVRTEKGDRAATRTQPVSRQRTHRGRADFCARA